MNKWHKDILSILDSIEGGTSFCSYGNSSQLLPGLEIDGYGEVSFPINTTIYNDILNFSRQAPFGKGSKTVTDVSVRSTQEIDAEQIKFNNPNWGKTIQKIVKSVKEEFAIENKEVSASLYKFLIYKEGDFFLPHKDSEKEKGMFASLIIGLPSKHSGGELIVKFDGKEQVIDCSKDIDDYKLPYVAFYADCEHEVKQIKSGYRACLVYNLIQMDSKNELRSPSFTHQVNHLSQILKSNVSKKPQVVLLDHQYTPANFSRESLKRRDISKADVIIEASNMAGYYSKLGLLTCYQEGDLLVDYDYNSRYYGDQDFGDAEMGDVFEEYINVEHWLQDGIPNLGHHEVSLDEIITNKVLKDGNPLETEQEGYTGNAGMVIEYWYHYGAVILWPKAQHIEILSDKIIDVRLQWLEYFLSNWETQSRDNAKQLLSDLCQKSFNKNRVVFSEIDFSPISKTYIALDDSNFASQIDSIRLLAKAFRYISKENWLIFGEKYPKAIDLVFNAVGNNKEIDELRHLMNTLIALLSKSEESLRHICLFHVRKLSEYLNFNKLYSSTHEGKVKSILSGVLTLSSYVDDEAFFEDLASNFTSVEFSNRRYVNNVLIDTLICKYYAENKLVDGLVRFCKKDLLERTRFQPNPPKNWSRELPNTNSYKKQWLILKDFIESPDTKVFDYSIRQSERTEMQNAIKSVKIDLKMETITKGSPHTLRITKTQKTFENKLKEWKQDVFLLKQLKTKFD